MFDNQMKYATRKDLFSLKVAIVKDMRILLTRIETIEHLLTKVGYELDSEATGDGHVAEDSAGQSAGVAGPPHVTECTVVDEDDPAPDPTRPVS